MKNTFYKASLAIIFGLTLHISASKAQENKDVPLTNYNGIKVANGIDLFITQSNSENIRLSADREILEYAVVEKEGDVLSIHFKKNTNITSLFKKRTLKAYVNVKTLESLTASGGSDVVSQNQIKTQKLVIRASGGSDVKLDIVVKDLDVTSSGGSDVNLKGTATNLTLASSGGSDVKALDLIVDYAKVKSSGGSDVDIHVNKALEVSASSGSDVSFRGEASLNKINSSKSADVKRIK